jgi:hypothetical protein
LAHEVDAGLLGPCGYIVAMQAALHAAAQLRRLGTELGRAA